MRPGAELIEREVAVSVVASLLPASCPTEKSRRWFASQLLTAGEDKHAADEARLREVARDICREFGFPEPP